MNQSIHQVEQWILSHHPELDHISHELDLIDNRLIDSLRFMEFIFLLEQLSDKSIDTNSINIDDFRTLQSIAVKFLTPPIN